MLKFIETVVVVAALCLTSSRLLAQDTADDWDKLCQEVLLLQKQGKYDRAVVVARKALEVAEKGANPDQRRVAKSLANLAAMYRFQGKYAQAEPLLKRSLAIFEQAGDPDQTPLAVVMNNLASVYVDQGRYAQAEPLFKRSLEIREKALGPDHLVVATGLNNLGQLHSVQGQYAQAEPLYKRSLAIREKALGPNHPIVATSLNNLAIVYDALGRYAQAEPLYKRSLAIREKALGPHHPDVAIGLGNLAVFYRQQGQYAQAESLYKRALAIREKALGPDHPDVATSLSSVAVIYRAQGQFAQAEPLLKRSLAIRERALGPNHPDVATSLNNLATLYIGQGQFAQAELLHKRSLAIQEKAFGPNHPSVATSLHNFATLYVAQGQFAQAEPLLRRSLAIGEKTQGPDHPEVATGLSHLALLLVSQKNAAQGESLAVRSVTIMRRQLDLTAAVQSESGQLAMNNEFRWHLDAYLSVSDAARTPAAEVYSQLLAWKGAVSARQLLIRQMRAALAGGEKPEVARLYSELSQAAGALAALSQATPDPRQVAEHHRKLKDLSDRVERLQASLSGASAEFRQIAQQLGRAPQDLLDALPADAVLVDLLEYSHCSPPEKTPGRPQFQQRLTAFVLRPGQAIVRVELGPVEPITAAVDTWRRDYADHRAAELRRLIWEPLLPYVKDARTILVSPDGPLTRFPLAALPGSKAGSYLIDDVAVAMLPVPQMLPDLMSGPAAPKGANEAASLLLVGGVDFDADPGRPPPDAVVASAPRGNQDGTGLHWTYLKGSLAEGKAIQQAFEQQFPQSALHWLQGPAATKRAVIGEAGRNRYLHFATHGFFTPPDVRSALAPAAAGGIRLGGESFGRQQVAGFHPGLLSGLVLAGANRPMTPDHDDGILTALEVAELDLSGVELATLSACDTGLGETAGGEGALGLQRAFQTAGCRNVIASLWKVDDDATAALMRLFYYKLWQEKKPPIAALREAQLAILHHPEQVAALATSRGPDLTKTVRLVDEGRTSRAAKTAPPRLWAAFVISGAPAVTQQKPRAKE